MPYTYIRLSEAKQALAQRLYVQIDQFFSTDELGTYIRWALRTFNAMANYYRREFVFTSSANTTWYDISNSATIPTTLRPATITVLDLVQLIEYHLLEPVNSSYPLTWTGSRQFSMSDILTAIQQVRDQLLAESICTVTQSLVNAPQTRIFVPDNTLSIRRVSWLPVSNPSGYTANVLMPLDIWGQQTYEYAYSQSDPGTPLTFRRSTEPPLSFDTDIQPAVNGQYDLLTINAGPALDINNASTLTVPNDWCWVIVFGALAQLLGRESSAHDLLRQRYALSRYQQAVAVMTNVPAVLAGSINDVPVIIESITNGDFYDANWQAQAAGTPTSIYYTGLNMLALSPKPDAGPYSVTVNVVSNMEIPRDDGAYLQIGRDDLNAVLDYAQHLAMFKCGGYEFTESYALYESFLRRCRLYNSKLSAWSPYLEMLDGRAPMRNVLNPNFEPAVSPATVGGVSSSFSNVAGSGRGQGGGQ